MAYINLGSCLQFASPTNLKYIQQYSRLHKPSQFQHPHLFYSTHFYTYLFIMCVGHPKQHSCSHSSMTWAYCLSAPFDKASNTSSPCGRSNIATPQLVKGPCPLGYCRYPSKGGSWMCCQCNQGPNTLGWCTQRLSYEKLGLDPSAAGELQGTCDHGCCDRCTRLGKPDSSETQQLARD